MNSILKNNGKLGVEWMSPLDGAIQMGESSDNALARCL